MTEKEFLKIESYLLDREKPNYRLAKKIMGAVEKRIHKEPILTRNILFCPDCGVNVPTYTDHNKYCRNCGQALCVSNSTNIFTDIRQVDDIGRIAIPKEMRKKLGIQAGQALQIIATEKLIIIEKYESEVQENEN